MLGSFSDRLRIVNEVSFVFSKFLTHFGRSFFVAGAVFGGVRQWPVSPRIANDVSYVTRINH